MIRTPPAPRPGGGRLLVVDWARGAAYVLMVIAHVSPGDGPVRILLVSEFLTAPLFALLIGVGAQLSWSASSQHGWRYVAREVLRAALVFALGMVLAQSAASVLIVLMHLAVLMLLCLPLAGLRTSALAVAGGLAMVLAVAVPIIHRGLTGGFGAGPPPPEPGMLLAVLGLVGGDGAYRLTGLLLCAVIGMLTIRVLQNATEESSLPGAAASALAFAVMLALLVAPNLLGLYEVHAYDGTPWEQLGVACGALGILLAAWTLQVGPIGRALPPTVARILAAPGQAALTLYALQILVLHLYQVRNPLERDDHWWMLALLILLGIGVAVSWQAVFGVLARRVPAAGRWVRGPLEGLIRRAQDLIVPLPPHDTAAEGRAKAASRVSSA